MPRQHDMPTDNMTRQQTHFQLQIFLDEGGQHLVHVVLVLTLVAGVGVGGHVLQVGVMSQVLQLLDFLLQPLNLALFRLHLLAQLITCPRQRKRASHFTLAR